MITDVFDDGEEPGDEIQATEQDGKELPSTKPGPTKLNIVDDVDSSSSGSHSCGE